MSELTGYRYLPPHMAERLRGIEINVRRPMDGSHQGLHRSPSFGSSVEFAEYREYLPGDPISRIDWPVYARSDRYVIRRFHEDVSIHCCIMLDISGSMAYKQGSTLSKMAYGSYLAAAMCYLMLQQGDIVSLIAFDDRIRQYYEPTGNLVGLKPILRGLEAMKPGKEGNIEATLHDAAELVKGKALVVIISDFLEEPQSIMRGIHHLYHDGKEITAFHVLDPTELNIPTAGLVEVTCLESPEKITLDFRQIRDSYLNQVRLYLDELRAGLQEVRADYMLVETRTDVYDAILRRRSRV